MKQYSSSRKRIEQQLSESTHRRVNSYALAATAAGVGVLALAQPSEAKIVYTPKHLHLSDGKTVIDLNHDGTSDFRFSESLTQGWGILVAGGVTQKNLVWGGGFASALPAGVRIGDNSKFQYSGGEMVSVHVSTSCTTGGVGPWANVHNRYLGLKFYIKGTVHYGWARLTVFTGGRGHCGSPNVNATLTGYAYETNANKPIVTGKTKGPDVITVEPATLGQLARGSSAISAWRGKER